MPAVVDLFANYATSTILGGAGGAGTPLGSGDTSLLLPTSAGNAFPAPDANDPFMIQLGTVAGAHELVKVTARTGDTFGTIVRAQEGTSAQAWAVGTPVTQVVTNGNMLDLWKASPQVFNVRGYGAKGDGATDDTSAIAAAITAASAAGGVVYFPFGTYLTGTQTLFSNVHIRGDGIDATIIKLKNTANVDVFQGQNFNSLTGTNNASAGVGNWSIRDLVIDGNKANNTSGYGIRVYGYGYSLENVIVRNCANDGIYSEWATAANVSPVGDSLEAHLSYVKSHDNLGNGITWAGPHDSFWDSCDTFLNGTSGDGHSGMYIKNNTTSQGGRLQIMNCHSWGNSQSWAIKSEASLSTANNQWEGAQSSQVLLTGSDSTHLASDSMMNNDVIYAAGVISTPVGLEIGTAAVAAPTGLMIRVKLINLTSGAVKFTNDGGLNAIRVQVFQTSGTVLAGSLAATTLVDLHAIGSSGTSRLTVPGHLTGIGSAPTLGALQTGIATQAISGTDMRGVLTLTTPGASPPAAGAVVAIVNFNQAYVATPSVIVQGAGGAGFSWTAVAAGSFQIVTNATLAISSTYFINFIVIG